MDYFTLKTIHQSAALISIAGFVGRGLASLAGSAWVRGRLARTLPHLVDTVLLVSALALAWMLRLSPGAAPWLMAKLVALVVYIVLGAIAIRPGRPRAVRATALVGAVLVFGYIVSVAMSKNALGFLARLA